MPNEKGHEVFQEWQKRRGELSVVAIVCRVIYFPLYYANVDLLRTYAFTIWFFCCALLMGAPLYPEIVPFFEPNKTRH